MNFTLSYLTTYDYSSPVTDSLNSLRVRPATNSSQRCDEFHVRIDPEARIQRHVDYFGTEVIEFEVPKPHDRLLIDVRARVATSEPFSMVDEPWEMIATDSYKEVGGEFLLTWPEDPQDERIDAVAAELDSCETPAALLRALCELIPDRFAYRSGVTYVGSSVTDFLDAGAGVCQDFVHLSLLLLRRRGLAARYVSGYLWSAPEDGSADSVEVQTHAWLEALMPDSAGRGEPVWIGADPTNRRLAGETHVKIGHGRRYADIAPVKGVYRGPAGAVLDAKVQMTRQDPAGAARA